MTIRVPEMLTKHMTQRYNKVRNLNSHPKQRGAFRRQGYRVTTDYVSAILCNFLAHRKKRCIQVCLHIFEGEIAISNRLTTSFILSPVKNVAEETRRNSTCEEGVHTDPR